MTSCGEWLCFMPRSFDRARDYGVFTSGTSLPAEVIDSFIIHSEELLGAHRRLQADVSWQYTALTSNGPVALLRCSRAERAGARAIVVWGLVLPMESVHSAAFALHGYSTTFPPENHDGVLMPDPVVLSGLHRSEPQDALVPALAAAMLASGHLRLNTDSRHALRLFSQI